MIDDHQTSCDHQTYQWIWLIIIHYQVMIIEHFDIHDCDDYQVMNIKLLNLYDWWLSCDDHQKSWCIIVYDRWLLDDDQDTSHLNVQDWWLSNISMNMIIKQLDNVHDWWLSSDWQVMAKTAFFPTE